MTSKFIQSGNNIHEKIEGENGALQFKSSSNDGFDLFFQLVRGYDREPPKEREMTDEEVTAILKWGETLIDARMMMS